LFVMESFLYPDPSFYRGKKAQFFFFVILFLYSIFEIIAFCFVNFKM
jgi:hypothetical protein